MTRILSCCGCGIGWKLQLGFDPKPGNFQMPQGKPKKKEGKKKKKKKKKEAGE